MGFKGQIFYIQNELRIIKEGLQLHYDASDIASYPGTGTTVFDLSGNGNNGTLTNGVSFTGSRGGGTFVFDGVNDYIDVNQSLASNEFSIGVWMRTTKTSKIMALISKENSTGNAWNYRLWIIDFALADRGVRADIFATTRTNLVPSTAYHATGAWFNFWFTRASGNMYLYSNGSLYGQRTDTYSTITNPQEVWIGASNVNNGDYFFEGDIAAAYIYNRRLSDTEIYNNFQATRGRFGV